MKEFTQIGQVIGEKLYRYSNSFGHLVLRDYPVLRETRSGKWARDIFKGTEHWVSGYSKKRFAYPTKEEALINFIKRTECHIRLAECNLELAKESLERANVKQAEAMKGE